MSILSSRSQIPYNICLLLFTPQSPWDFYILSRIDGHHLKGVSLKGTYSTILEEEPKHNQHIGFRIIPNMSTCLYTFLFIV